jgi:hypothetical protein
MATKQVVATGTMSNLVGMWAHIWKGDILWRRVFIQGKADNGYYIVQFINALTGAPNVARIVNISEMTDWQILPTIEIADEVYEDYGKHKTNRYEIEILPPSPDLT